MKTFFLACLLFVALNAHAETSGTACISSDIINTAVTTVKTAVSGGTLKITDISCSNLASIGGRIDFYDGASLVWSGSLPIAAVGGAYVMHFGVPIVGTNSTDFKVQLSAALTATRCCINYFV